MRIFMTIAIVTCSITTAQAGLIQDFGGKASDATKGAGRDLSDSAKKAADGISRAASDAGQQGRDAVNRGVDAAKAKGGDLSHGYKVNSKTLHSDLVHTRDKLSTSVPNAVENLGRGLATVDQYRLQTLDQLNAPLSKAGCKWGDQAKVHGAVINNTYRAYTHDLDGMRGWLREVGARPGDLVFAGDLVVKTGGAFGHVAIVTDVDNGELFEAVPGAGVHRVSWSKFARSYAKLLLCRVDVNDADAKLVARWVEGVDGAPYRWPLIDGRSEGYYCTTLVTAGYDHVLKVSLYEGRAPCVHPDDLAKSSKLKKIAKGRNW